MRLFLFAAFAVFAAPAFAADALADRYLECLVGKGSVEVLHGTAVEVAMLDVRKACHAAQAAIEATQAKAEGDVGDIIEHRLSVAAEVLKAVSAADAGL